MSVLPLCLEIVQILFPIDDLLIHSHMPTIDTDVKNSYLFIARKIFCV